MFVCHLLSVIHKESIKCIYLNQLQPFNCLLLAEDFTINPNLTPEFINETTEVFKGKPMFLNGLVIEAIKKGIKATSTDTRYNTDVYWNGDNVRELLENLKKQLYGLESILLN